MREDEPDASRTGKSSSARFVRGVGRSSVRRHEALRSAGRRSGARASDIPAIAPSSAARSKSGQKTGTNTSSL